MGKFGNIRKAGFKIISRFLIFVASFVLFFYSIILVATFSNLVSTFQYWGYILALAPASVLALKANIDRRYLGMRLEGVLFSIMIILYLITVYTVSLKRG